MPSARDPDNHTPVRQDKQEKHEAMQAPMLEVAGAAGPILVHRLWTLENIHGCRIHLPAVHEVGGLRFGDKLLIFCREFRPTTNELRHLLMTKLGNYWAKVS